MLADIRKEIARFKNIDNMYFLREISKFGLIGLILEAEGFWLI